MQQIKFDGNIVLQGRKEISLIHQQQRCTNAVSLTFMTWCWVNKVKYLGKKRISLCEINVCSCDEGCGSAYGA